MSANSREKAMLMNLIRVGTVDSVDTKNKAARVRFPDKSHTRGNPFISAPLKVLQKSDEMWLPKVGRVVVCIFLPHGEC
jgi:phage baseplate assembly protein gpV